MPEKKLLLHTCCGPCLTQCLSVLSGSDGWEKVLRYRPDYLVTVFFDNPNIYPGPEYEKRKKEAERVVEIFGNPGFPVGSIFDMPDSRRSEWAQAAKGFPDEPEKGARCRLCYRFRLEESFRNALHNGYDSVATTLTLSPWKDADAVNETGMELSKKYGPDYIESDFKKNGGYQKSVEICSKFGIYRQNYCGCIYSLKGRGIKSNPPQEF